jgi:hypothetical protein
MTSPVKKVFDWFWRGSALAEARQAFPAPSERESTLAQRARQSAEAARNQQAPVDPPEGSVHANACESYRQAAYWALSSLAARNGAPAELAYTESMWDGLDEQLLTKATERAARADALRTALRNGSFVYFAELPREEQVLLCSELQSLVELLFEKLNERSRVLLAVYFQSGWRLGFIVLLLLAGLIGVFVLRESRELAHGKPWRASSALPGDGCKSPAQVCAESPSFFFHTHEEDNPWVEFDLGAAKSVSAIQVDNREDCCSDRAFPLAVEVSTDHKTWKTVVRKDEDFKSWRATFESVNARWVRLHVLKHTYFHLAGVRIYP